MTARQVYFTAPREVAVREEPVPEPAPTEVRVQTTVSAVSPGTELLIYRGEASSSLPADMTIDALDGSLSFPVSYGYATAGRVTAVGADIDQSLCGTRVFAFHPHASHFVTDVTDIIPIPDGISMETAVLLPTLETAVNLVLDGAPILGERVTIFGQGVIGLMTTALVARFPIDRLVTMDLHDRRRHLSESVGADVSIDPRDRDPIAALTDPPDTGNISDQSSTGSDRRADLTFELSGNPEALDMAIDVTGFDGWVIIGSWYGTKPTDLRLDGRFHRSRIQLISSQVSTIAPQLRGRWDRDRRRQAAWQWLDRLETDSLITHRLPVSEAAQAYDLLETQPEEAVQVLLTY